MNEGAERKRLRTRNDNKGWKRWGPYMTERQWGTVREDYSADGNAWGFLSHDMARSKAYRWGEDGIGGICDNKGHINIAFSFWNHQDGIIKERLYGLTSHEANHGEDVKELYYYLDSTPTHSYMKMLYKYPQQKFPYGNIIEENRRRSRLQPEYELIDTGVFDDDKYFDIVIEYAKADEQDVLFKVTVHNRGDKAAPITVLPTIWFRNIWVWGYDGYSYKPILTGFGNSVIDVNHKHIGRYKLYCDQADELLFCDNETNLKRLYNIPNHSQYCKDGINNRITTGDSAYVNPNHIGTKAAARYTRTVPAGGSVTMRLRFVNHNMQEPFKDFDEQFKIRLQEADDFYDDLQKNVSDPELRSIQRQAYAGMLWTKQFYYYNVNQWLAGDPAMPKPTPNRKVGRNAAWKHMYTANILSMPDKWEYPWFAAWDLAFHTIPLARLDPDFAKRQLAVILREYYMHPNGQIPAYEWNFSDVNPPVHAWACWRVYEIDKEMNGKGDVGFLERVFHKLLLNFTWWVNQKDESGNNIFGGGFLGLDNIGVFDRSAQLPTGGHLEQADGTGWMAMYTLNMLRIACEISLYRPVYQDMASKFFEHFLHIAGAMQAIGSDDKLSLWDEEDQFYYDLLHIPNGPSIPLRIRSMVGLIPLYAVEVLDSDLLNQLPDFKRRVEWILTNRPDLGSLVSRWYEPGKGETRLLSILRGHRMRMILKRMFDTTEFLSDFGIRTLSKYHNEHPYEFYVRGEVFRVNYTPAESDLSIFGGNSNWRGPIWFPLNFMVVDSLLKFHQYYGDDFEVEYPTNSGNVISLQEAAYCLSERLVNIFKVNELTGERPVNGDYDKLQKDPHFKDHILFYEYFHGDNGAGLGASHQTGWTGLVAELIEYLYKYKMEETVYRGTDND